MRPPGNKQRDCRWRPPKPSEGQVFNSAFTGYSVDDVEKVRSFYKDTLGLEVKDGGMGIIHLPISNTIIYPKGSDHRPAEFTVLNLEVDDVSASAKELASKGVQFEQYPEMPQDADGVMKGHGPDIAWFKDPAGKTISIIKPT